MDKYHEDVAALAQQDPELARQVGGFNTLENVLTWMKGRGLPLGSLDVIAQDEFSVDVLVPLGPDGRHLVFGAT
jgi:hypothetical protein